MQIVVTGGAGFIGKHLLDWLVADGHDVLAIDDFSRAAPSIFRRKWVLRSQIFRRLRLLILRVSLRRLARKGLFTSRRCTSYRNA